MQVVFDDGKAVDVSGRLKEIIGWLVANRHVLRTGDKQIEFLCRGDSVRVGLTIFERADLTKPIAN